MRLPPIEVGLGDVATIQPTWHCLLRFRQRGTHPAGADAAMAELRAVLEEAHVDRWPPPWAAGQEAERWAVSGDWAFPLERVAGSVWAAPTCLRRGMRARP
jgi:hypothetical protein